MTQVSGKEIRKIIIIDHGFAVLCLGGRGRAKDPQYGGALTFLEMSPIVNPMSWDVIDMNWKHGYDSGFYMERLLMGDLQKGPFSFGKDLSG